jgi:magnesium transporter
MLCPRAVCQVQEMAPASHVRVRLLVVATQYIDGMDNLPTLTTATFIGIVIAVTGNILISLALNLQKLAHKRIGARILARQKSSRQNGKDNDNGPPNGRHEHRSTVALSLDENDEDSLQRPSENYQNNNTSETQSLLSSPNASSPISNYRATVMSNEQRKSFETPLSTHRKIDLFSPRLHSGVDDDVQSQDISPIPVDFVSDELALSQQGSGRKLLSPERVDVAVDSNETEYLGSKLWHVLPFIGTFVLLELIRM